VRSVGVKVELHTKRCDRLWRNVSHFSKLGRGGVKRELVADELMDLGLIAQIGLHLAQEVDLTRRKITLRDGLCEEPLGELDLLASFATATMQGIKNEPSDQEGQQENKNGELQRARLVRFCDLLPESLRLRTHILP
jgi:hypothetical protein